MSGFRFSALRQRTASWIAAGLGASVAVLLSLMLAVMAAARQEPPRVVGPGVDVDTGRWRVRVLDAAFRPADPKAMDYLDRQDSLVVRFRFANRSAESSNSFGRVASIDPPDRALETPTYLLGRDRSMVFDLHPDMPEEVLAVWKWPPGKAVPKNLRLSFMGEIHKSRDNLYGAPGWFPTAPVAAAEVPVSRTGNPS